MARVVFITGASSGIGKAAATFLTNKGFRVYGTSRNPDKVSPTDEFELLSLDVSQEDSIQKAIAYVLRKEGKIDVLINNAGVGITGAVEEIPSAEIQKVFATNLYGPIALMKAVLPHMRAQKKGLIINISSIAGYMGLPYRGVYSATKGALALVTEAMRMEVKDFGVHITQVAPGDFATDIASRRYHTPVYPESPYQKPYSRVLNLMDAHVHSGGDPRQVALLLYRIINTRRPKTHYTVGSFLQKFSVFLKQTLPGNWFEKMMIRHYKL